MNDYEVERDDSTHRIEKKLDALIDALGFDVETKVKKSYGITIKAGSYSAANANVEYDFFPATKDMKEAEYREVIRDADYKLTKRANGGIRCTKCGTNLASNSPLDSCLCKSTLNIERF